MRADGLFERESYEVNMYWGARQESAAECARRAQRFCQALGECDPALRHWYTGGRRIPKGLPGLPVDTTSLEALEKEMLRGRNRTDRGKRVIEDLGLYNHWWNEEPAAIRLDIKCGAYCSIPNRCHLAFPSLNTTAPRLLKVPMLVRLMRVMVEAWDLDYGLVTTNNHILLLSKREQKPTGAGWVTYVSRRQGEVPAMPEGVRVEPLGEHGTLLVLPVERFTADNAEHVAMAGQVRQRLLDAGLLELRTQ
jgi:hypothetical protein